MGRDLINLFFPVYRRFLFFFLTLRARSRALASFASSLTFSKRTKRKIKQRLCAGFYDSTNFHIQRITLSWLVRYPKKSDKEY